jgi:hypothetical protein
VSTIDSNTASTSFPRLLVHLALTSKEEHEDAMKAQCNNLFHISLVVKEWRVLTIIDTGSRNNLESLDLLTNLVFPLVHYAIRSTLNGSIILVRQKVITTAHIHFLLAPIKTLLILMLCLWKHDRFC